MYKMCNEPINVSLVESEFSLDNLPLNTRRKLLLSSESIHGVAPFVPASVSVSNVDCDVKRHEDCFNSELGLCAKENGNCVVSNDLPQESIDTEISESTRIDCNQGFSESENLRLQNNTLESSKDSEISVSTRIDCNQGFSESENLRLQNNILESSKDFDIEESVKDDVLEHISLKERRKLLVERMALRCLESNLEVTNWRKDNTNECDETDLYRIKADISSEIEIASSSGIEFSGFLEKIDSVLSKSVSICIGLESGSQVSETQEKSLNVSNLLELSTIDDEQAPLASKGYAAAEENPRKRVKRNSLPLNVNELQKSSLPQNSVQRKVESLDECIVQNISERNLVSSDHAQVKREVETDDEEALECTNLSYRMNLSAVGVKNEVETANEVEEDEIDHMTLIDRLKLRSCNSLDHEDPNPTSGFSVCSSENIKPLKILRPWNRKKTATDSIETALDEDAPGLLQVLIQQGVSVDELRLYGGNECSDESGNSVLEESFSELEDVISQLFFNRQTSTKLLTLRFSKGSRTSYCLTCLFSLIEQARYLRFRKWPVEWGWCRDLQSFIFVFERHNRIVMERPEYGYATYFFELLNTASISWQIKRLVVAMKLASCGRYQMIENKPLLVGVDLSETEAGVLMKYGWVPNTGLGTMLNYRDRVFHDRKTEKQTSEWRSKICKLLVDGYTNGTIVSMDETGVEIGDKAPATVEEVKVEPCYY